jgi:hypothetical protein
MSSDGSKIVFYSNSTDLTNSTVNGANPQIYLYDGNTDTTKLISHADGAPATESDGFCDSPSITSDGSKIVYFSEASNIYAGSVRQIYCYNTITDMTTIISHCPGTSSIGANGMSLFPKITPDGTKVVFQSEATDLISGYTASGSNVPQIYLRTLDTDTLPKTTVNIAQGEQFDDKELAFSYAAPSDVVKTFYRIEGVGSLVPNMTSCAPGTKINIGKNANWPDGSYTLCYLSVDRDGDAEYSKRVGFSIKSTIPDPDPGTNPGTNPGTDPGTNPGTDPGTDPGTNPGTNPGTGSDTNPGTDAGASIKISSIKASQKTIYVAKGKKVKLPYIINAAASGKVSVNWKASKKKVASVGNVKKAKGTLKSATNKNQKLTIKAGKKLGTSKITLTSGGKKLVLKVKVVKNKKAVAKSSVKIKRLPKKKILKVGKSKTIKAAFTKKATAIVTWKSSKPKVIKIDASGKITALKKGKATITLKVGGKTKKIAIKVK